jgi:phage terminase large subunit-like protein
MPTSAARAALEHPAHKYAKDAAAGTIVVSRWVQLAAKRHLKDLTQGAKRGLRFDEGDAQFAIDFFSLTQHSLGALAGQPIKLEPWQQFIVWCVYGWKRADGTRRFRTAYVEIAKGNGKSTMCAALALELLVADGEPGAEVYCAATKKDQAKIVFGEAERMRKASPSLAKAIQSFRNNLSVPATNSKLEPLGADEDTLDGLNIHGLIVDELHAHKTRAVLDVLRNGTVKRRQPLTWEITTAGSDRTCAGWNEHEYACQILDGHVTDDTTFAFIAALDPGDDWEDEKNWAKPNPNLGVNIPMDYLRENAVKAKAQPSYRNSFLRFHMNVWTQATTGAISIEKWNECVGYSLEGKDPKILRAEVMASLAASKRRCFAAVDLASKVDLASLVLAFEPDKAEGAWILLPWFWMPKDNIADRAREDRVPYDVWEREGFIAGTPGTYIDQDFITAEIVRLRGIFNFSENLESGNPELALDPWNASQFAVDLQNEGFTVVEFRQGYKSMSEPTKSYLGMIPAKRIAHLGHPVLSWQAGNLMVETDPAGNLKPTKEDPSKKIDGQVASIMALGRGLVTPPDEESAYTANRGVMSV